MVHHPGPGDLSPIGISMAYDGDIQALLHEDERKLLPLIIIYPISD